jgi:putative flippase GtrA
MVTTSELPRAGTTVRRLHPSARALTLLAAGRERCAAVWLSAPRRRIVLVYGIVGLASNIAYLALFHGLQSALNPLAANVVAMTATTVGNTAAHRRYTFGIRGWSRMLVAQLGGFAGMAISLAVSTVALTALDALDRQPSTLLATTTLWVATGLAVWVRFGPLRKQIGPAAMRPGDATHPGARVGATAGAE